MKDLRALRRSGRPILNCWLSIPDPFVAEVMARAGFDSVCLDMQHGLIDATDLLPMLQAIGQTDAVPLVRVPGHDPAMMMKALDAGARGLIVPLVNTAEEAAAAVSACRYPPQGTRSFGPIRAALVDGSDYHLRANEGVLLFAMIETRDGLTNLDAVAATPGLDGIYVGPADLSYALGLPPQQDNEHPEHLAAVARIFGACERNGLIAGLHSARVEFAREATGRGAHLVTIASDVACLKTEAARRLAAFEYGAPR